MIMISQPGGRRGCRFQMFVAPKVICLRTSSLTAHQKGLLHRREHKNPGTLCLLPHSTQHPREATAMLPQPPACTGGPWGLPEQELTHRREMGTPQTHSSCKQSREFLNIAHSESYTDSEWDRRGKASEKGWWYVCSSRGGFCRGFSIRADMPSPSIQGINKWESNSCP